jgi:hypothetical protein
LLLFAIEVAADGSGDHVFLMISSRIAVSSIQICAGDNRDDSRTKDCQVVSE